MYDVDTIKIDRVLAHNKQMLELLKELISQENSALLSNRIQLAAIERALHLSIEAIADVGNSLIDGFIMRDPGSYVDIVEILRDERVVDEHQAGMLTEAVSFRKQLINEYTEIDHARMLNVARAALPALEQFAPAVRAYLQKELF